MDSEKDLMQAQLKRVITQLFKNFLIITDDIRQDHLAVINQLESQFPKEILQQWNYLDLAKYSRIRKKILDSGNDAIREVSTILLDFDICFLKERTLENVGENINNVEDSPLGKISSNNKEFEKSLKESGARITKF